MIEPPEPEAATAAPLRLRRPLVLVGLMGAGKTSVGKRLAGLLGVGFTDSDHEIVEAAGMSIPEIFASLGEPAFRDGERDRDGDGHGAVSSVGGLSGWSRSCAWTAAMMVRAIASWLAPRRLSTVTSASA